MNRTDVEKAIAAEAIAGIVRLYAVMRTGFSEPGFDEAKLAETFRQAIVHHKEAFELGLDVIAQQFPPA